MAPWQFPGRPSKDKKRVSLCFLEIPPYWEIPTYPDEYSTPCLSISYKTTQPDTKRAAHLSSCPYSFPECVLLLYLNYSSLVPAQPAHEFFLDQSQDLSWGLTYGAGRSPWIRLPNNSIIIMQWYRIRSISTDKYIWESYIW